MFYLSLNIFSSWYDVVKWWTKETNNSDIFRVTASLRTTGWQLHYWKLKGNTDLKQRYNIRVKASLCVSTTPWRCILCLNINITPQRHMGSGGIAPRILKLDIVWSEQPTSLSVSFASGKSPPPPTSRCLLDRRLSGPRAGLDPMAIRKYRFSDPTGNRTPVVLSIA
jgi:hypothetical protein